LLAPQDLGKIIYVLGELFFLDFAFCRSNIHKADLHVKENDMKMIFPLYFISLRSIISLPLPKKSDMRIAKNLGL
jgi:hypothetical protein